MKSRRALQRENKCQNKMLKNLLMYAKQMSEPKLQNFMTQELHKGLKSNMQVQRLLWRDGDKKEKVEIPRWMGPPPRKLLCVDRDAILKRDAQLRQGEESEESEEIEESEEERRARHERKRKRKERTQMKWWEAEEQRRAEERLRVEERQQAEEQQRVEERQQAEERQQMETRRQAEERRQSEIRRQSVERQRRREGEEEHEGEQGNEREGEQVDDREPEEDGEEFTPIEVVISTAKETENFTCPVCHKNFFKGQRLRNHYYVHTGEKPYKCEKCDYATNQNSNLDRHKKTRHQKSRR